MEKKKKLEESWQLMRWTLKFIEENGDKWKMEEEDLLEEEKNVLERWNTMKLKEKLQNLNLTEADTTPTSQNIQKNTGSVPNNAKIPQIHNTYRKYHP